eukprot:728352_1
MLTRNEETLVHTALIVRESVTDWDVWVSSLFKKYKNEIRDIPYTDDMLLKRLSKSKHRWKLNKSTTFGQIRSKLSNYYNINPFNIEIWLQTITKKAGIISFSGSDTRVFWDETIDNYNKQLITDSNEQKWLFLKFEFVAYNIRLFDAMTLYHTAEKHRKHMCSPLALFRIAFYAPNQNKTVLFQQWLRFTRKIGRQNN